MRYTGQKVRLRAGPVPRNDISLTWPPSLHRNHRPPLPSAPAAPEPPLEVENLGLGAQANHRTKGAIRGIGLVGGPMAQVDRTKLAARSSPRQPPPFLIPFGCLPAVGT